MVADIIQFKFPPVCAKPTMRGLLAKVVKIYDPLGVVSPITLCGKLFYRETYDLKIAWHKEIPEQLSRKLTQLEEELPSGVSITRACLCTGSPSIILTFIALGMLVVRESVQLCMQ